MENYKRLKIQNLLFKGIVFFALLFVFPQIVFGIGQTTDPIIINDAMRGETFQKEMIVINTDKESTLVAIKADGDILEWIKFFKKDDLKNPIDSIMLKAGEKANLFAEITIPKDIKNGKYSGVLSAIKTPKSEVSSGSSTSVSQKIDRQVDITVNDKENIALKVSVIPEKYDLEEKEPLNVRFIYDNQGNVSIKPEINLKIKKDEKTLFNISYPFAEGVEAIRPGAVYEIPSIEIPTSMLEKGRYVAEFDFVVDQKTISNERFKFAIGDVPAESAENNGNKLVASGSGYKNWIVSGLVGIFAIAFMIYGFSKVKNKRIYIKKPK